MTEEPFNPEPPDPSAEELSRLIREGGPPLTRREIRQRDRAEKAGLLTRVDGRLVVAEPAPEVEADPSEEPPIVTSADVLAGNVPAASGLTRRQLRELAAQHEAEEIDTGELETTVETDPFPEEPAPAEQQEEPQHTAPETPRRISTRVVATELDEQPREEAPAEQTARRPVVHPEGAQTGEYTGEFDQIRQAMADINAAPDTPPKAESAPDQGPSEAAAPRRRSIFEASVPAELNNNYEPQADPADETSAADWTAVIDAPVVTDDLLPQMGPIEPPVADAPASEPPEPESSEENETSGVVPTPGDDKFNFPDWHTLTSLPAATQSEENDEPILSHATNQNRRKGGPLWLTILQWVVIAVIAVVLGLLVWYAINRGFGSGTEDASGILSPRFYLRI